MEVSEEVDVLGLFSSGAPLSSVVMSSLLFSMVDRDGNGDDVSLTISAPTLTEELPFPTPLILEDSMIMSSLLRVTWGGAFAVTAVGNAISRVLSSGTFASGAAGESVVGAGGVRGGWVVDLEGTGDV